jgi:indole-3-acetate monooxygenase
MASRRLPHDAPPEGPHAFLLDATRDLRELFEVNAEAAEAQGALTDTVIDALHDAGFFGLYVPTELGGVGANPVEILEVIEAVSYAEASTGWIVFAPAIAIGTAAAFLDDVVVKQLFGGPRMPVIAGSGIPRGGAVPETGGYRLSGTWSYASGLRHAQYAHAVAFVVHDGPPEMLAFTFPVEEAVLGDNWDVLGLRATGSIDFSVDGVFVPEEYSYPATMNEPRRGGSMYTLGNIGIGLIGHTAWALGVGRRMADELAALAQTKRLVLPDKSGAFPLIGESESFQEQFAMAEAKLRGARALAYDVWREITDVFARVEVLTTRQNTLYRTALHHATWTAVDVADLAYNVGGGTTLRRGVVQRLYRDIHSGAQHITSSAAILRECGRELVGLAPGERWDLLRLVAAEAS